MREACGLILAAGRGSRLGRRTADAPKGLAPLCGRPLLAWQILALRAAGLADVTAIGGYRADALAPYVPVVVNARWQSTNMVQSMIQFPNPREVDVVVSYSDIVYSPTAVEALLASEADITITYDVNWSALWGARFDRPLEDAESFRTTDGRVIDIGRRGASAVDIEGQYMGLIKFSARAWKDSLHFVQALPLSVADKLDMTSLLGRLIAAGWVIAAAPYTEPWAEVDTEQDLMLYEGDQRFESLRAMLGELAGSVQD